VAKKAGGDLGNLRPIGKKKQKICRAACWQPGKPLLRVVEMFSI
jgi:hypothetical protein